MHSSCFFISQLDVHNRIVTNACQLSLKVSNSVKQEMSRCWSSIWMENSLEALPINTDAPLTVQYVSVLATVLHHYLVNKTETEIGRKSFSYEETNSHWLINYPVTNNNCYAHFALVLPVFLFALLKLAHSSEHFNQSTMSRVHTI